MLTEILVTALALLAGVSCGWLWFGSKQVESQNSIEKELNTFTRSAERVMMAISQVHDVASRVAQDVGSHSSEVGRISSELESLRETDAGSIAQPAVSIISEMLTVNEKLQEQLALAEEKLKSQSLEIAGQQPSALVDSLTGLPNRRAFDAELARHFAEWKEKGVPFSLAIFDIDHLREINDTHGIPAGDEVLRQIGRKLHDSTRDKSVAFRFGGEEFLIIYPRAEIAAAAGAALRLRKTIESTRIAWEGKQLRATACFGVAQSVTADNLIGLLRRADEALDAARGAGRNQGFLHDGNACFTVQDRPPKKSPHATAPSGPVIRLLHELPQREQLEQELERRLFDSRQYGLPLSLLSVRVPDYEQVLAEEGQQSADLLLDAIALGLQEALREIDYLARVAGSRFAIILPGSTEAEAKQVAKRIGATVAGRKVQLGAKSIAISLAIELASYRNGESLGAVRLLGDEAPTDSQAGAAQELELTV